MVDHVDSYDELVSRLASMTKSLEKMGRSRGAWYVEVCRDLRLEDSIPVDVV